ncbi:hypothetical protein ACFLYA_01855 [Candidatus Dependentiae bacterium]
MKQDMRFLLIFLFIIGFLPGCLRVVDWGKENFYQGQEIEYDLSEVRKSIISKRVYDQFTLVGSFDVLWLSDCVRTIYSDIYSCKHGKTEEQRRMFLRRQLEENNHFIAFYVLSLKTIPLGDTCSEWSLFLRVGCKIFTPTEIKVIEICPEYREIFGKKYNNFKDVYLVYFNAKDVEDNYIIHEGVNRVELIFRSVDREVVLPWCF